MAIDNKWQRLSLIYKEENILKLNNSSVMVVGVGGVGAMCAEALCRSGIGTILLVDKDTIEESNINRQILSTSRNIGQDKTKVMKERLLEINPNCHVICFQQFFSKENSQMFEEEKIDYVVDAIDTISSKMDLIEICHKKQIPFISSLGMGNRIDPSKLIVTTLDKTSYDPLAKVMRQMAKKREMNFKIPVVFSLEPPMVQNSVVNEEGDSRKEKIPPASSTFVPNAAGLLLASVVVNGICGLN